MSYTTKTEQPFDFQLSECELNDDNTVECIARSKGEIRPEVLTKYENGALETITKKNILGTLNLSIGKQTHGYFKKEKQFECWVDEIVNDVIYSRGRDVDELGPEVVFELATSDVDENDRELIKESAVFMVKIGKITTHSGQVINKTIIKFRRFKVITELDLEKIAIKEKLLAEVLGIEA